MDRRTFIGGVTGGLLAVPIVARAQQVGKVYRIGILEAIPAAKNSANLDALRKGLRDLGYVEGRNLIIEYRSADGRAERSGAFDRSAASAASNSSPRSGRSDPNPGPRSRPRSSGHTQVGGTKGD